MSEQEAPNAEELERALHLTKNRIAAVDIARILAALLVMFGHLEDFQIAGEAGKGIKLFYRQAIGTCSPVFFLFAGYFACRNITWKKALNNAMWCLLPYVLWVGVAAAVILPMAPELWPGEYTVTSLLGLDTFTTWYDKSLTPINGPLWFMRDLVFLFLLSPLLYRWSRWLFPLIVLMSVVPGFDRYFEAAQPKVLAPYSIGFFTLGCYLRGISKERQQWLLRFHSGFYITAFLLLGTCMTVMGLCYCTCDLPDWWRHCDWIPEGIRQANAKWISRVWDAAYIHRHWGFIPGVLSIWALYQTSRCIEVHCPRLTQWALKLAPVTFLTFAAHWMIYTLFYLSPLRESAWLVLLPFLVFALMTGVFFALKRWCRPLLHLVAHYKLRPDDK